MSNDNADLMVSSKNIFETRKKIDSKGQEYWPSRDLAKVLKYSDYRKFLNVIEKGKVACKSSYLIICNTPIGYWSGKISAVTKATFFVRSEISVTLLCLRIVAVT